MKVYEMKNIIFAIYLAISVTDGVTRIRKQLLKTNNINSSSSVRIRSLNLYLTRTWAIFIDKPSSRQGYRMKIFIVDLDLKTRIDKLMFLMPAVTNLRFRYRKRCQGKFHAIALILKDCEEPFLINLSTTHL